MADVVYLPSAAELRAWLAAHHDTAAEVWLGFYKITPGRATLRYQEALDEALCFGWIDGLRKRVDEDRYTIRFSPRKPKSPWSEVNVRRAEELCREGRMHPSGLQAFQARDPEETRRYSYEARRRPLDPVYEERFRANPRAWSFFESQPPSYRRTASWWVMSARKEETRQRRLATLIKDSEQGRRIAAATPGQR